MANKTLTDDPEPPVPPDAPCPCGSGRKYRRCHGAHKIAKAEAGTEHERTALDRPGVILWRDIWEKPYRWHAM